MKTSKEAITSTEEDTELSKILEPEAMGESIVGTDEHEEEKLSPKDEDEKYCPDCSRLMRLREDKYGKFWECLGFPECRHTESFDKLDLKMICPICRNGEVIIKRTQIGTRFYVCSNKGCEFITWHLPYAVPCPECNNPFLVEKKDRKGKSIIKCPRAGCHYQRYSTGKVTPVSSSETSTQKTKKVRKVRVKTKSGSGKSTGKIVRKVVRVKSR